MSIETAIRAEKRYKHFTAEGFVPRGTLSAIWTQWLHLFKEAGNVIPQKKSISMQRFKDALPDMIIAERTGPDEILVRLSGTRIDEMRGFVISGKNFLDIVQNHLRHRINAIYTHVSNTPCGFYISEDLALSSGKIMELDILVLPLADANGEIRFFLSGYHFSNRHLFNPFEDNALQVRPRKINKLAFIDLGFGIPYK